MTTPRQEQARIDITGLQELSRLYTHLFSELGLSEEINRWLFLKQHFDIKAREEIYGKIQFCKRIASGEIL